MHLYARMCAMCSQSISNLECVLGLIEGSKLNLLRMSVTLDWIGIQGRNLVDICSTSGATSIQGKASG